MNAMLDDLALFLDIVRAGSLSRAAQQAGIPAATLTRRLQKLEAQLGCQLLHRSPRGLRLTPEGQAWQQRCQPLLGAVQQAVHDSRGDASAPRGLVRVQAPLNMATLQLKDFWPAFLARHPGIDLDLRLDNRNEDLLTQAADLALRTGPQSHPSYMQRRLARAPMQLLAAPAYLARHAPITHPSALAGHNWLLAHPLDSFELSHAGQRVQVHIGQGGRARLRVNEISLCALLAARGLGLDFLPRHLCAAELTSGQLVPVLPQWQAPVRNIYAVWLRQGALPARVRVLLEALAQFLDSGQSPLAAE